MEHLASVESLTLFNNKSPYRGGERLSGREPIIISKGARKPLTQATLEFSFTIYNSLQEWIEFCLYEWINQSQANSWKKHLKSVSKVNIKDGIFPNTTNSYHNYYDFI